MIPKNLLTISPNGNSVLMAEKRPLLTVFERRPLGALLGQREGGPIVGALLRMRPEARGTFIRKLGIDMVTWAISIGAGRFLASIIELNLAQFLGRAAERGGG